MKYKILTLSVLVALCVIPVQAQTIDTVSDVAFGGFDFETSFNATVQLGTNGSLSVSGSGLVSNGGEDVGHLRVASPDTGIIDVKCASTAVLSDATATDITIQNIEIAVDTGVVFGAGDECQGLGGGDPVVVSIDMVTYPDANIYIGGEFTVISPMNLPTDHTYSTGGSGTPIMLSIVVQ